MFIVGRITALVEHSFFLGIAYLDIDNAVRGQQQILVDHEGQRGADSHIRRIDILHIDQRTDVIGRFHRAGEHCIRGQANEPHADKQHRQQDHSRHQQRAKQVAELTNYLHIDWLLPFVVFVLPRDVHSAYASWHSRS